MKTEQNISKSVRDRTAESSGQDICRPNATKVCRKCKEHKEQEDFYKNRRLCKLCLLARNRVHRGKNKSRINAQRKLYRDSNKDLIAQRKKDFYLANKKNIMAYKRKWHKLKYQTDINYRTKCDLRTTFVRVIRGNSKKGIPIVENYAGCSVSFLKQHLENLFLPGMNWGNHSFYGWHIDHIIPLRNCDFSKESSIKEFFHYTNLRPLWGNENLKKGHKKL